MSSVPPAYRNIVTIGSSAGGLEALLKIAEGLPPNLAASLFIVSHTLPSHKTFLADLLNERSQVPVALAGDGDTIELDRVYVARPDFHLLLADSKTVLSKGPRVNRTRPAIDPLFRTAAADFGARTIGVVLSGTLDDGTAGLVSIKRCGGIAIVQDPKDALFPEMPENAKNSVDVDYVVSASDMGPLLARLTAEQVMEGIIPDDVKKEALADLSGRSESKLSLGRLTDYTCPDCGGPIWEIGKEKTSGYSCIVGHQFTEKGFVRIQTENTEDALWAAVRSLEQDTGILQRLSEYEAKRGRMELASRYSKEAGEKRRKAAIIRKLVFAKEREEAKKITKEEPAGKK